MRYLSIIIVIVIIASCKPEEHEKVNQDSASIQEKEMAKGDSLFRDASVEISELQKIVTGKFTVSNNEPNVNPIQVSIDDEGRIVGSKVYQLLRIYHFQSENRLILIKGENEFQDPKDTFDFEPFEKGLNLYQVTTQQGKFVRVGKRFTLSRVN
jgi:hypothetical protein